MTSLHEASKSNNLLRLSTLLNEGANVHATDGDGGWQALHLACREGHAAVVDALLAAGARPGDVSNGGWTSLHCAAAGAHTHVVEQLLGLGCNAAPVSAEGDTPMHWAAQTGSADVMRLLLSAGAPPLPFNSSGITPLHIAAQKGHAHLVDELLRAGGPGAADVADRGQSTPLHNAAQAGHLEVAELLLAAGAAPNAVSNVRARRARARRGRSVLRVHACWAVRRVRVPALRRACCAPHANATLPPRESCGTLHSRRHALGHIPLGGADASLPPRPLHRAQTGFTPLNHASESGHVEVAQLLCNAGAFRGGGGGLFRSCCGAR
jgi:hypothetical protein